MNGEPLTCRRCEHHFEPSEVVVDEDGYRLCIECAEELYEASLSDPDESHDRQICEGSYDPI